MFLFPLASCLLRCSYWSTICWVGLNFAPHTTARLSPCSYSNLLTGPCLRLPAYPFPHAYSLAHTQKKATEIEVRFHFRQRFKCKARKPETSQNSFRILYTLSHHRNRTRCMTW